MLMFAACARPRRDSASVRASSAVLRQAMPSREKSVQSKANAVLRAQHYITSEGQSEWEQMARQ
jgi:hypothetical protein